MTATPANPRVTELRELFKQLLPMRATFEETGLEEVVSAAGNIWSIWDLEYLLKTTSRLTRRQQQAITLCLVHGMREKEAAVAMGVSVTNPVMMYATLGLQRLLDLIDSGELTRFRDSPWSPTELARRHVGTVETLVEHIEKSKIIVKSCWLYPTTCAGEARLLVRSTAHPLGYTTVSPMQIMFERYVQPVPRGCLLKHTIRPMPVSLDCVNPQHGALVLTPERQREVRSLYAKYQQQRKAA